MRNDNTYPTIKSLGVEVELAVFQNELPITCGFFKYKKNKPLEIDGHLFTRDASFLELAVAPATEPGQFDTLMCDALAKAGEFLPKGAEFRAYPCVEYTDAELAKDPYASELGCAPSQTIYEVDATPMPSEYPTNHRYGGTHINLAMDNPTDMVDHMILKLDYALGLYSVINWEHGDRDGMRRRRHTYGQAGEYRIKPFGFEYRTLPNNAILSGPWLWRTITAAMQIPTDILLEHASDIASAINDSDPDEAQRLLDLGLLNGL